MTTLLVPALDLTRVRNVYVHGDLTVFESWWMADEDGPVPCIVILPTNRQSWEKAQPCVVTLKEAWKWSEEIGDPAYAVRAAHVFCETLGFDPMNPNNLIRIRSMIVDHLGDLLSMPPVPLETMRDVEIGEAKLTGTDGTERHTEIIDRV